MYSDQFVVGGCKWRILAYPNGNTYVDNYLSLYLDVADSETLPSGWRRRTKFRLTVVNQLWEELSEVQETQLWFDEENRPMGYPQMLSLTKLLDKRGGFLVNGEVKIAAEVDVLEVIGKSDVLEETSYVIKTMDVNGFQVLPSQAKSVSRMFERHPETASEVRSKNPNLRKGYMSLLLSLIDTMCQSPQELTKDDLTEAYAVLGLMRDAGFNVNWLARKLDKVSGKKENEEAHETRLQEMEKDLKEMKRKCSDMEDLVEKKKGKILAAKTPFSFDDVV